MLNARRLAIIALISLSVALNNFGADKLSRSQAVGSIVGAKGSVLVDHQPVLPKEVVFSGDVISTGVASGAYLNLGGTTAILVENAEMEVAGGTGVSPVSEHGQDAHATPTMTLRKGAMVVRTSGSQTARVNLPGAFVLVGGNPSSEATSIRIAAVNQAAVVVADRGEAEIHGAGAPTVVRAGKTVKLENGVPQGAAQQRAGGVYKQIPLGYVSLSETELGTKLSLNDAIYWGNWVTTQQHGRIQILLGDGSYLNVGADAKMHIIKHDATTHQTELEIRAGSVKAAVQKVAGASFKATTPTAVIGVQGTILQWEVISDARTDVASIEDDVTVGLAQDPSVPSIVLHTGQSVSVFAHSFSAIATLGSAALQAMQNKTNVKGGFTGNANAATQQMAQQMATGGGVTGAAGGLTSAVSGGSHLATAAVAGAGAGITGGALSHNNSANNSLNNAGQNTSDLTSASNQVTSTSTQTTNVSNETTNQIQQQQQNCGCPSPNVPK